MAPRKPMRWWEAHPGAVIALALALAGGWLVEVRRNAEVATRVELMLKQNDREQDSLERRVAALENRGCRCDGSR